MPQYVQPTSFGTGGSRLIVGTTTTATSTTWASWNEGWLPASSSTTISLDGAANTVWTVWVDGNNQDGWGTTAAATTGNIWINWVDDSETPRATRLISGTPARAYVPPVVSAEEKQRRTDERIRWQKVAAERKREKALADERAMMLLRGMLTAKQNGDLQSHGHFFVRGQSGKLYRIDKGRAGNVKVVNELTKQWVETLCVHQREHVPHGDTMLMQKLLIETAEELFRSYANINTRSGGLSRAKGGLLTAKELDNVVPIRQAA